MRLIKVTGGLGNQMFIYAFYLRMKKYYPKVRIDLSDMMHYKVHYGYEMHRVFNLPHTEFCINQPLKKVIEFLFFKKIYERKQAPNSLRAFEKKYFWPLLYFKGFYQSERFFADIKDEVRESFTFDKNKANSRSLNMLEIQKIALKDGHAVYEENGEWKPIDDHALVSMNFWRIVSRKSIFFCIISNASEVQWSTLKSSISNDLLWILCIVLVELATVPTLYVSYSFHQ